jgi:hypothetical protein
LSQRIIIKVAADGSTQVSTEGFVGSGCQKASQFIERALGSRQSEQLTQDYCKTGIEAGNNTLEQGEGA